MVLTEMLRASSVWRSLERWWRIREKALLLWFSVLVWLMFIIFIILHPSDLLARLFMVSQVTPLLLLLFSFLFRGFFGPSKVSVLEDYLKLLCLIYFSKHFSRRVTWENIWKSRVERGWRITRFGKDILWTISSSGISCYVSSSFTRYYNHSISLAFQDHKLLILFWLDLTIITKQMIVWS